MKDIIIFKSITTNEAIEQLEEESKKYDGLHVDMENKDERKFVKDKASLISSLIKQVTRKRIDESKDYKIKVDNEASGIIERLEIANLPFTGLMDTYKAERALILAEEKEVRDAKELAIQIEIDHEDAIQYNKLHALEKAESERQIKDHEEKIKSDAIANAVQIAEQAAILAESKRIADIEQATKDEANRIKAIEDKSIADKLAREADIEHRTSIKTSAKESLMQSCELTEAQAIAVVKSLCKNEISNVTINF